MSEEVERDSELYEVENNFPAIAARLAAVDMALGYILSNLPTEVQTKIINDFLSRKEDEEGRQKAAEELLRDPRCPIDLVGPTRHDRDMARAASQLLHNVIYYIDPKRLD